jgi:hypothetical protein
MPQYYANNLVAGGAEAQQKSNGAFFKNARAALRKIKRAPITVRNAPGYSLKPREGHAISAPGSGGNPDSKAIEFVSVPVPPGG